jgi:hypothetical protein
VRTLWRSFVAAVVAALPGSLRRRLAAGALLADRSPSEITNAQVATVGPALHVMQENDPDGIARAIAGCLSRSVGQPGS